jgi:hypothetical protein
VQRRRGYLAKTGWAIWYLFCSDEKGEYLDHYPSHRMTDDTHMRIYADGTAEELPSIATFRIVSHDPAEDARLEAEYFARNQEVARMLEEKDFGMTGSEPSGVAINSYLHLNPTDE